MYHRAVVEVGPVPRLPSNWHLHRGRNLVEPAAGYEVIFWIQVLHAMRLATGSCACDLKWQLRQQHVRECKCQCSCGGWLR